MNNSLNPRKANMVFLVSIVVFFCLFVLFWEKKQLAKERSYLHETAEVTAGDLWRLDADGLVAYLKLAAEHQFHERLTVFTASKEIFLEVSGQEYGFIDRALETVGLIPLVTLDADVMHNGKIIGSIEAIHRHGTIYLYFYLILVAALILLVSRLYLHTVEARNILEVRVTERTRELVDMNQDLQQEIQERIRAEKALGESEERYREIYNAPSDAIIMHDAATGAILDVNRAAVELYGYSYDELLVQTIGSLSSGEPPYDMEHGAQRVGLAMTKGPQLFDWRVKKQNGDLLWVEVALRYTEFSDQKYVIAVVRDVSQRKAAEVALAAEKERLAVTLRSIGDGVITTDIEGVIILINKVAEDLTGWSCEEAAGKPLAEVFTILNEQTRQRCENPVTRVLASGEIIALANHTILISRDGSEYSIADSGAPIRDENSEVVGVVLVFRDVTAEREREAELAKGRKLESVGLLAGGIAHDFNNILTAIMGNINLALLFSNPEERAYALLQDAEKASLRAKDLTQQLLTFSKGGEPIKELATIKNIIEDSACFILRGSNVSCNFHCDNDLWPVEIDQGQVSQVIQNIIINADQAMPKGGEVNVYCSNVSCEQCGELPLPPRDYLRISIQDSGIGMAGSLLENIFDPYFTTKQEGSGLGLAVSHSIISKHGGYITVESEPGRGTTFTLYLPAERDKKLVVAVRQEDAGGMPGKAKIMIMDDDEMVRSVAEAMLNHFGYEVILARDGVEAISFYREALESDTPIDLVVMDLTIPGGMGGQEAVREIHKIDPQAKIIVSSGYSNDPIMANYRDHGFLGAMTKPFQLHDFKVTLQRVL
ncbi:PAS domain S-box [Desulfocapsa sulfexigens DSM 10523]|uniref:histidine kinase n=1 Tax=Desulfocapsa sulfexigens (strain DSM 10523 / SB164P1) TaxID=1167006 RepID=M1P054_DESSD|nr:PAS domain S-box [Desulfocapsa sulfexigens DSM 10523]